MENEDKKLTPEEIQARLDQASGTGNYHRWSPLFRNFVLTDGAKECAELCGAYWLMDAIASHYKSYKHDYFSTAKLVVTDQSAILTIDDGNGNIQAKQRISYTDFPLPEIKLFIAQQDTLRVIMLPGEY